MTSAEPVLLGRYRILGELGRGTMGVVYRAEDPSLKRSVAIKIVLGEAVARQEALQRFRQEAESAARLHHPNIVSIFDVGEDPTFGPYLAMEFVAGESLQDKLRRGPLAHCELVEVAAQGALALECAHRMGVLHRDIKPGNFMIAGDGSLKLMDFGIAHGTDSARSSGLLCTPAYASPELLGGSSPTPADDRWAYAVTIFQCLTGRVPFPGATITDTLAAISRCSPAYPDDMSPELLQVFRRSFARDPAQRHGDLRAFMLDLIPCLSLEATSRTRLLARLDWQEPDAAPSLRSWRWIALGTSAAAAATLLLWVFFPVRLRPVAISSTPSGAQVRVDGVYLGRTPLLGGYVPLKAKHLEVRLEGYVPVSRPLGLRENRVAIQLEPLTWKLPVRSRPAGAEVRLDGFLKGKTPLEELEVPGQEAHVLELRHPGYRTWTTSISRERHPEEMVALEPEPRTASRLRKFGGKLKGIFKVK